MEVCTLRKGYKPQPPSPGEMSFDTAIFPLRDAPEVRGALKELMERPDDHREEWSSAKCWRQMWPGNKNHFVHL